MAGFFQLWSAQQLEQGVSGCPNYKGTTGPNTHALVISNDSECVLDYRSDVDPLLVIPARTSITIPCTSNMQYVISVDEVSVPTQTSNQLVIASETPEVLAYSSTPLPAPNLIQFIATIFATNANLLIPPQFTAIIIVPIDTTTNLQIFGRDTGFEYYNGPFTTPLTIQMFPGLDPSGLSFQDSGAQINVYGLTLPLTEIGTAILSNTTIANPTGTLQRQIGSTPATQFVATRSELSAKDDTVAEGSFYDETMLRAGPDNADAIAPVTFGLLKELAYLLAFNGTNWDRLRSLGDNADTVPVNTLGALLSLARLTAFNGTSWDRLRTHDPGAANANAPAGLVTVHTARKIAYTAVADHAYNVAAGAGVNGALGALVQPNALIAGVTFSGILRGTSPGAAEAELQLSIAGIPLANIIVTEGEPFAITVMFPEPLTLNNGGTQAFHFNNIAIVGTAIADMTADIYQVT